MAEGAAKQMQETTFRLGATVLGQKESEEVKAALKDALK